jgi:hypothetical protein
MRMLVLPRSARAIRSSSTGSENAFHHSPRGCASAAAATVKLPPSLKVAGVGGSFSASIFGSEAAQPARSRTRKAYLMTRPF